MKVRTGASVHRVASIEELTNISSNILLNNKPSSWMVRLELLNINNKIIKKTKLLS
jgi:hypothetical protein